MQWKSGAEMQHLKTFAFSIGNRYQELVPLADLVSPNKTHDILSYEGWAYCARTPDKNNFLAYFEKGCPTGQVRGARLNSVYRSQWFNPRNGTWIDIGNGKLISGKTWIIKLPELPEDLDWGLKLVYEGPQNPGSRIEEVVSEPKPEKKSTKTMMYVGVSILAALLALLLVLKLRKG
jgi:hypothetical protein